MSLVDYQRRQSSNDEANHQNLSELVLTQRRRFLCVSKNLRTRQISRANARKLTSGAITYFAIRTA